MEVINLSSVVSKIRCYNPSDKKSPSGNANNITYIANREMAIYNESGISTFGDIKNLDLEKTKSREVAEYVKEISKKRINVYRGIISLKEEDAVNLGYNNREEWENMMNRNVIDIAKNLGISVRGLEWVAVVHLKKGNPHLHYQMWDTNQNINRYFINVKQQEDIRKCLIKDIYSNDLSNLYNQIDNSKKVIASDLIETELKALDYNNCKIKIPYIKVISSNEKTKILNLYNELKNDLPKTGSLKYRYLSIQQKRKLDILTKELININMDLKNEYENHIELSRKIGSFYGGSSKNEFEEKTKIKLNNMIGNKILKYIKVSKFEEMQNQKDINNLITSLFQMLSKTNESLINKNNLYQNHFKDMSKQAKLDYMKNKANSSSIDWG